MEVNKPKAQMKVQEREEPKTERLSYEKLADAANQLHQQNQQYLHQMKQMQFQLQEFARGERIQALGFAFKVLDHAEKFDKEFVTMIVDTIKESLTPIEEEIPNQEVIGESEEKVGK